MGQVVGPLLGRYFNTFPDISHAPDRDGSVDHASPIFVCVYIQGTWPNYCSPNQWNSYRHMLYNQNIAVGTVI